MKRKLVVAACSWHGACNLFRGEDFSWHRSSPTPAPRTSTALRLAQSPAFIRRKTKPISPALRSSMFTQRNVSTAAPASRYAQPTRSFQPRNCQPRSRPLSRRTRSITTERSGRAEVRRHSVISYPAQARRDQVRGGLGVDGARPREHWRSIEEKVARARRTQRLEPACIARHNGHRVARSQIGWAT